MGQVSNFEGNNVVLLLSWVSWGDFQMDTSLVVVGPFLSRTGTGYCEPMVHSNYTSLYYTVNYD